MNQKLTAPRALTALIARRAVRFATLIAMVITLLSIAISSVLVYFFTPWWWLLAVFFILLFGVFIIIRVISMVIIRIIHPNNLTTEQTNAMNEFVDTIQELLEAKSTPLFLIALICIKDILFYRDIVTVKKTIQDTVSLRTRYAEIEKLFEA